MGSNEQEMESESLAFCMAHAGTITGGNAQHELFSRNALDKTEALPNEAAWDLDD